ncbi:MAG: efflux RND transporter periplasmic adaptor subunit [Bacteroidales bacterium]|nr:efflux RND transporter periplasmic adaptor subunit [Bacteroidales bacterium]
MNIKFLTIILWFTSMAFLTSCRDNSNASDAFGNFEATEYTVSAEANGQIFVLNVEEGQKLVMNQQIGIIDTIDLSLKIQQISHQIKAAASRGNSLNAQVAVYREQLSTLSKEKERFAKIYEEGAVNQKTIDDLDASFRLANRQMEAAQSQYEGIYQETEALRMQQAQLRNALTKCYIKSPADGVVIRKFTEAGELANMGKALFKMADLEQMILRVYINGNQLSDVFISQDADIRIDDGKGGVEQLKGTVSWISPEAEFTPKTIQTRDERVNLVYAVKIAVKSDGRIKIGQPGEVVFVKKQK